jgi:two-component system chemotaxis response regulator CheY
MVLCFCFLPQKKAQPGTIMYKISNSNNRTVLIVEDDSVIRELLKDILELEGYSVSTAGNGQEAIDLLRAGKTQPKLVLLDMMMPVMDGASFLNIVTKDTTLAKIPVYIHSASLDIPELNGARGLIRKPSSYETIVKLVESYCD